MREQGTVWQIFGPLALFAALALAAALPLAVFPADLLLAGGIGLYFCARYRLKGCSYALILLAATGLAAHLFFEESHFLRLGLEASFACSFFIAALCFEEEALRFSQLDAQLASRLAAIQNLEEEIGQVRGAQVDSQISFERKFEEIRKISEELQSEKSSLEILNDVLRKANAAHSDEKRTLEERIEESKRQAATFLSELQQAKSELNSLKGSDLAAENRSLLQELNRIRFDRQQERQINETLARMHASVVFRAKESDERLRAALEEKQKGEELIAKLQEEIGRLSGEIEKAEIRLAEMQKGRESEEVQEFKMRLAAAELKVHELAKSEFLYRQLKSQFEEKNRVLHEARSALFKAETQLQTKALEKEEREVFLPEGLRVELDSLEEEIQQLKTENLELQDLVTHLIREPSQPQGFALHRTPLPAGQPSLEETLREALIPKKKKKTKKPVQQDLLF